MELILLKDVENVGSRGDVVRVKDGFARNFLLPQKSAMAATRANRVFVEEQRERANKRHAKERAEAATFATKLSELKVAIEAKVGENDKLFGSVTAEQVCTAINEKGYQFRKKQVQLKEPIRSLGTYLITVDVYPEVKAKISVEVVAEAS